MNIDALNVSNSPMENFEDLSPSSEGKWQTNFSFNIKEYIYIYMYPEIHVKLLFSRIDVHDNEFVDLTHKKKLY